MTTRRTTAEKVRLDKYLWAIRLFKTRSQAADACEQGKVKLEGTSLKAARTVSIGDIYDVKTPTRRWRVQVTGLLDQRKASAEAMLFFADLTPEEERQRLTYQAASFQSGKRLSKIGRPTKKERRDLDGFFSDDPS
ncbi:MAG: hypothetical protein RJA57_1102 [Bacteroidota bacterium]|jgi:ribosome-associated heat shock protein Hsp15